MYVNIFIVLTPFRPSFFHSPLLVMYESATCSSLFVYILVREAVNPIPIFNLLIHSFLKHVEIDIRSSKHLRGPMSP